MRVLIHPLFKHLGKDTPYNKSQISGRGIIMVLSALQSTPLIMLSKDGSLLFQQVPMVEIDGMNLVQTRAILNYIATKYNLYGKDIKERALYGTF